MRDQVLADLRKELASASTVYLKEARAISKQRVDAAKKLERLVETVEQGVQELQANAATDPELA